MRIQCDAAEPCLRGEKIIFQILTDKHHAYAGDHIKLQIISFPDTHS